MNTEHGRPKVISIRSSLNRHKVLFTHLVDENLSSSESEQLLFKVDLKSQQTTEN